MWRGLWLSVCVAWAGAEVLRASLDGLVDADLEFYNTNLVGERRMAMRLEGDDWWIENATITKCNKWSRAGPAEVSLDTDLRQYSYSYSVEVHDIDAVLDSVKLPGGSPARQATLHVDKAVFKFGPMTRTFLGDLQCNSSLVVDLVEASGSYQGQDVSKLLNEVVAPAFNARSRAKCTVVNPHPCPPLLTPLSQGYF